MEPIKRFIFVLFLSLTLNNSYSQSEPNELSAYYGFEEMEVIKLKSEIIGLQTADFNGDGRVDISIANNTESKIEVLVQKESIGSDEEFVIVSAEDIDINAIKAPSRFARQSVGVSQKVYSLVCGDLNSDGMVDLAFYGDPKGLYVILQKSGPGTEQEGKLKTLNWRTRKKIEIEDGLLSVNGLVCADLNNDRSKDLVLAGRDGVYIILQKEGGSLAEPVKYAVTSKILGIYVIDLNGDNINDLILITNDIEKPIYVRFGLETGELGPQIEFFIEKPYALECCDIDGEAGDEILSIDFKSRRLACYKFSSMSEEDSDWPILFYPLSSGEGAEKRDLSVGDFDGDGLDDIMISDPAAAELIFYKQFSGVGLTEPLRFPAFSDIVSLSSADIDKDGKVEVGVLSIKEKVIGIAKFEGGRLSFPEPIDIAGEPLAMDFADVDLDGGIDCVYISKDADDTRYMRIIYSLGVSEASGIGVELKGLSDNPDGLKVMDVDQNGLQDVLVFVKYELPILILQNERRSFERVDSTQAQMSLIQDAGISSTAVADVDEGGGQELLVAQNNFARSLIFSGGERWSIVDQYNAKSKENKVSTVGAFNISGDEVPRIFLLDGQKGRLQILKAGEDKTYRFEKEIDVGKWNSAEHLKMVFAALSGSEIKSIVLFDGNKFSLVMPSNEDGFSGRLERLFGYETKIKDGRYGNITLGDINDDKRTDIIMVEPNGNHFEILALDSELNPVPAMRFKIFEQKSYRDSRLRPGTSAVEPREMKIADVTGDRKDDLVTVIHDRIIVYPQD